MARQKTVTVAPGNTKKAVAEATMLLTEGTRFAVTGDPASGWTFTVNPKVVVPKSRPERWSAACSDASTALDEAVSALNDLVEIKSEYEDWQGNLPENLEGSALAEKLSAVVDLDFDGAIQSVEEAKSTVEEAESADLPRGFGKD